MKRDHSFFDTVTVPSSEIGQAVEYLRHDQIVAFPTETVYGLGAHIFSPKAINLIYQAKGRPSDNPLIAHIAGLDQLSQIVTEFSPLAQRLAAEFWPGPLTLILPRRPEVPAAAAAGLPTIGVRWPAHPVAQALISALGQPVVAPSANLSGRPSPTTAAHVAQDLAGQIPLILDGGPCQVGIESTIVDLTPAEGPPVILRPGAITAAQLSYVLGKPVSISHPDRDINISQPQAPGMKYRHYAPQARLRLVSTLSELPPATSATSRWILTSPSHQLTADSPVHHLTAQNVFALFRAADQAGVQELVVIVTPDLTTDHGLWNRVSKAAALDE